MRNLRLIHILTMLCFIICVGCGSSDGKSFWQSSKDTVVSTTKKVIPMVGAKKGKDESNKDDKSLPTNKKFTKLNLLVNRGENVTSELVIRELELKPKRVYEDYIDLGTCYLWTGNFIKAAEAYEIAAQVSSTPKQLGGALYNKASAIAFVSIKDSLPISDMASRILPDNLEIARLRFALHTKGNNQLGLVVAQDHLSKLDPSVTGHEVALPLIPILVKAGVTIIAFMSLTNVSVYALTPPEDRSKIVGPLMEGYRQSTVDVFKTVSSTFSKKLIEGTI